MLLKKLLLLAVLASCSLGISVRLNAQTLNERAQADEYMQASEVIGLATDPFEASVAIGRVSSLGGSGFLKFKYMMAAAIDDRLGAAYRWGGTGPSGFDCSGFVWSTFRSAGIDFERGSARNLWLRFIPAAPQEEFKFGTLVFFSGMAHVGIVADEHGFYHASRHHGVVYSPFNDYWLSRIDGFRRVPLPTMITTD
jgi:NlpC/P60 family protein